MTEVVKKSFSPVPVDLTIPTLTIIAGPYSGRSFALRSSHVVLGRGNNADIRFDDLTVSRAHAVIEVSQAGFTVHDNQSSNGTFVGGARVTQSVLEPSARLQLGPHVVLRFSLTDHTEESLQRRLYEAATRDELTGAFNRKHLFERLESEVAYAWRHKSDVALIMLDLDHFKKVNDAHGHLVGDAVIHAVAEAVKGLTRTEDVFGRYGGEEFALVARGISSRSRRAFWPSASARASRGCRSRRPSACSTSL